MTERPNVLVVCGRNKKRSRTAEYIFKNDDRLFIRSVGLSPKSERKISAHDITWADIIFVMENGYKSRILEMYRSMPCPRVEVLHIEDEYEYLDEDLIELLRDRMNDSFKLAYGI